MKSMDKKDKQMKAFEEVSSYEELRRHLIDRANKLNNTHNGGVTRYICHYTNLDAAIAIIKNQRWYIGSPTRMNDGLELSHASTKDWNKTFFASFMLEPKESIAMWSMYAQPWLDGVMLRIPVERFKSWIKAPLSISSADPDTKAANGDDIASTVEVSFHAVAYTNAESKDSAETEHLYCGRDKNTNLNNILSSSELIGYVKDSAWSYENEYRLRVDDKSGAAYKAVSISIPDDIIDSFEIVAGPRFSGDLLTRIQTKIAGNFDGKQARQSIFTGKLNWVYCDDCGRKK